ncbi:facilitated trehalose transporter Tret1-like [Bombyx mandarina]|uniref:Facilitated trehalose transporter Tret1-like n=1 Tax=Bombyx mandarina TaxID=7092 RepID=A0A6J2JHY6_BOMMA|nr:facilitated trehalose transporter Tret1-like [Bombyx mandarina]
MTNIQNPYPSSNLSILIYGLLQVWTSSVLVKINKDSSVFSEAITETEASWMVSSFFVAPCLLTGPAAYVIDRFGRKLALVMSYVTPLCACFLYIFGTKIWMVIIGRFLCGIGLTIAFIAVPAYTAEIASTEIRGALGTVLQTCSSVGILIMFCIGSIGSYMTVNIIILSITLICAIPMLFIQESPFTLFTKDLCVSLAVFFKLKDDNVEIKGIFNYVPLLSLALVVFCYSAGYGSIYFMIISEIFEGPTRAVGVSAGIQVNSIFFFLNTKFFISLVSLLGASAVFAILSVNCAIGCLYVFFFVPETKGKSFSEIQNTLGFKNNFAAE